IFFLSVGMTIDPTQVFEHFAIICLVSLIVIVGQYGSVVLSSLLTGQNAKKAFQSAAALSQVGEFGFIIAGIGSLNQAAHPSLTSIVVSVSVITAFICPWLISHSDKFLQFSEHLIPKRLVLAFSLYIQMLEGFKTGQKQSWRKTNLYRAFKWILVDTVILLLLLAMALPIIQKYAVIILQKNHMPESWSKPLLYVSIATILMPFLGLIFFNSRKLATEVTYSILEQSLTSSSTQRGLKHIFSVMVYMGIYLLVGIPVLAVIRPFLQGPHILPVFLTISLLSVVYIYIRTSDLEIQTRSIVQEFTDFIQGRSLASYPQSMPELSQELYQVESFTVSEEDYANQKNLLDLNLRQATGASAIAIHRNEGDVLLPRGKEILLHNDTLILTGTKQAIVKAIQHLKKGRINE
ncbi:MAG: cation:proton antiporter, partial [Bdellovibrionales bacterium]|nr:cation:proton antiporter [Bdellovibrionales bacterium]